MLKTFSGGAFSVKDSIAQIYEKTVNAKIELDPVGQEDDDVDNDGDSDQTDKYLKKRRNAIKKSLSKKNKENSVKKESEIKLSGEKDHIKILKPTNEESEELDEGSDYQLYHKTFSGAMAHAYQIAKKRGYTVDTDDIDRKVAMGPSKPSNGKTNRYILGTDKKKNLHVQVANLDDRRYELNMYIEEVDNLEEKAMSVKQQRFMALVHKAKKGEKPASPEVAKAAEGMSEKDAKDFASTKHKGLPMKKEEMENESYDVKTAKTKFGKITVKSFDSHDDAKAHLELMKKRGHKGIISQKGKPVNEEEVLEACWPGYKQVGMKKKGDRMVPNCVKEDSLQEAKMSDAAALKALKALATNGKNEKTKSFANGVIKFYAKNKSFTPDQIAGLQNIMKNAGFQMAKEEIDTKGMVKINKLMEKRNLTKAGAGEEGTDELVKNYKKDTPGQEVAEGLATGGPGAASFAAGGDAQGTFTIQNREHRHPYRIFEELVHYLMGTSVGDVKNLSYSSVLGEDSNNKSIKLVNNKLGSTCLIGLEDIQNFYQNKEMTMEQFEGMLAEFGINKTETDETVAPHSAKKLDNGSYSMEQYTNYLTHSMKQQRLF